MLVDDHAVVLAGYRHLLQAMSNIKIVAEACSGEEAYKLYHEIKPDVTVMDISMPGMSGIETLRRIRAQDPNARILIFTMHDDTIFPARALEAGACGYISKSCAPEMLAEAIRTIAAGRKYLEHEVAKKIAFNYQQDEISQVRELNARDFEVFTLLAQGQSLSAIAERLHIDYKTVISIQTRIRSKLGIENTAQMVLIAIRAGIIKP